VAAPVGFAVSAAAGDASIEVNVFTVAICARGTDVFRPSLVSTTISSVFTSTTRPATVAPSDF
jgi:hypothetical protein